MFSSVPTGPATSLAAALASHFATSLMTRFRRCALGGFSLGIFGGSEPLSPGLPPTEALPTEPPAPEAAPIRPLPAVGTAGGNARLVRIEACLAAVGLTIEDGAPTSA